MDITRFFEPVQKFVSYLIDKVALALVTYVLVQQMVSISILEYFKINFIQQLTYGLTAEFGDIMHGQGVIISIVVLLILVAALEAHERVLRILNMLSPIQLAQINIPVISYLPITLVCFGRDIKDLFYRRNEESISFIGG